MKCVDGRFSLGNARQPTGVLQEDEAPEIEAPETGGWLQKVHSEQDGAQPSVPALP